MTKNILCPIDYSEASDDALRHAVSFAEDIGVKLLAVHVELPSTPPLGTAETPHERETHEHQEIIDRLAELCGQRKKAVDYEFRALRGDPAAEIVRLANEEESELIVMATAGRSGWRRLLLGSVAETVVRDAPCPVLTLKHPKSAAQPKEEEAASTESAPDEHGQIDFYEDPAVDIAESGASSQRLLERAIGSRASDIHIDPLGDDVEVRFRIDGRLEHYCRLTHEVGKSLVTQMKIMAEVDIADPFHAEEGRFTFAHKPNWDVRLTRVPVVGGEALALRLFNRNQLLRPLENLGLSHEALARIRDMLRLGEGAVLVTGPTGAGKTTTAYSMAHAMDDGHRNIVTMEDPVEYQIASFRQMSVDPRHGVTMTSGLRSLLRMDPDVVLVGEIRDVETAEMAMRAASSGKYVFTTIHTRDVASTVTAVRDLHIDNRSLAGNLTGIISERLVRRVCTDCCRRVPIGETEAKCFTDEGLEPPADLPAPGGCKRCRNTGYRGRIGIFEAVLPDRELREAIHNGEPEATLRDLLRSRGTRSLLSDALEKVSESITTLDEVRSMTWVSMPR